MAAQQSAVKVIEQSKVAPPQGSVSTTTVPLTFFDIAWFTCSPMQRIFFYEFPYPTLRFTQTVVPHLKQSLSLTLRHFFPFAGNLTCPPPPHVPYILFNEGDAVNIIVAESDADFNYLVANHARDVKTLQSLFPKLPFTRLSSNTTHAVPTMAIQFTVFPSSGISVGVTFNHVAADGRSINHFMKVWASIHRSEGLDLTSLSLPYHNKYIIQDPNGLSAILLKDFRIWDEDVGLGGGDVAADNVLITLVIKRAKIEQLKDWVNTQCKNYNELPHIRISSFVVVCAYMWVNLMKLQEQISGSSDDQMLYHFIFLADCRERAEFSIPATYFGNCLTKIFVSAKRRELMGESGVIVAAKAIGRKIDEMGNGALTGAEKWVSDVKEILKHGRLVSVAGSPRFRVYETDFGWGRPKKFEVVHIGAYRTFSLIESGEEDGGLEIGAVIGRDKLHFFNSIFEQSL